jgi:hypothetical protein
MSRGELMANDKAIQIDEVTSARKIKLVVTDSVSSSESESTIAPMQLAPNASAQMAVDTLPQPAPTIPTQQTPNIPTQFAPNSSDRLAPNTPPTPISNQPDSDSDEISDVIMDPEKLMRDLPVDEFFRVLEQSSPEQLQKLIHTFEKGARTKSGSKLVQKLISVPPEPRSLFSIVMWWEFRRPLYNIAVGLAGLPSLFLLKMLGEPMTAFVICAIFYGIFANVCYSLGTPAEMVAKACWKEKAENYGPVLLTLGTIFSVLLTIAIELIVISIVACGLMIRF